MSRHSVKRTERSISEYFLQLPRREATQAALCLLLSLLAFFAPAVFGGRVLLPTDVVFDIDPLWQPLAREEHTCHSNPALSDQVYQFLPWTVFAARSLTRGRLPLWNPYTNSGQPFLGNGLSGVFSPFNLLSYLLPLYSSYVVAAILRMFVAGIFTFLFAREIGLSKPGALLAMVSFSFSRPLIGWIGFPPSHVIVWLPAMLLNIERALSRRSKLYVVLCGLAIGAQFLGGQPESSFHVMLAWGAYTLYRAVIITGRQPSALFARLGSITAATAIGGALAMVQLLPFAAALLQSDMLTARQAENAVATSVFRRLLFEWHQWPTAITAILPQYFGTPLDDSYWYPYSNYIEQSIYAGVLPLALATVVTLHSLRNRDSPRSGTPTPRQIAFFALMAVACLGIALRLPLLNAVNFLPLFRIASNGRLRLVYAFAISILAGLGLDEIVRGQSQCRRVTLHTLILLALTSLFLIVLASTGFVLFKDRVISSGRAFMESNWGTPNFSRPLEYYYNLVEERYEKKLALFRPANLVMYLPVLISLSWLVLHRFAHAQRPRFGNSKWTFAALSLILIDAFLTGMSFNSTAAPQNVLPTPDGIQFLRQDADIYRISGTGLILNPNICMFYDLFDIRGYDAIVPWRYADLVQHIEGHFSYHFHSLFVGAESRLLNLLNVKYVLTEQELVPLTGSGQDGRWELAYQDAGTVKIYRNRDVLPRAFVVYQAEIVNDADQSLRRITEDAFDFRQRVVLEEKPSNWVASTEPPATAAEVTITCYEPNRVCVEVETPKDGLLVLTDAYMPGWKALVDGTDTRVYIANHAFRAIIAPAGTHRVEFVYRPLSFWIGATVSSCTVLVLLLILVLCWIKRSPSSPRRGVEQVSSIGKR